MKFIGLCVGMRAGYVVDGWIRRRFLVGVRLGGWNALARLGSNTLVKLDKMAFVGSVC